MLAPVHQFSVRGRHVLHDGHLLQSIIRNVENCVHVAAGRGGTCELMIGCIAKATSETLHMDQSEMDDVRWVSRDQLQKAVEDSRRTDTPYQGLRQPSNQANCVT